MSWFQKKLINTDPLMSAAQKRQLERERLKRDQPWLFHEGKRVATPDPDIVQININNLEPDRVVAVVSKYRCPKCGSSGQLWRLDGHTRKPKFQVRCSNYFDAMGRIRCDFALPEVPVEKGEDAVRVWRLALALQQ